MTLLSCLKIKQESSSFLNYLNSLHKNLKFTKEEERNDSLNFLDICVQRSGEGELLTKIYRKFNSEAFYVPWASFGPVKQKLGGYGEAFHQTLFSLLC